MSKRKQPPGTAIPLQPRSSETVLNEQQAQEYELFCPICKCLCNKPTRVKSCEMHLFCKECIEETKDVDSTHYVCSMCRATSKTITHSKTMTTIINRTLVRCINTPLGCGWTGTQLDAKTHMKNSCSYREECRKCEYCHLMIPGLLTEWHQQYECPGLKDVPSLSCTKRKTFGSHILAFHHDEKNCETRGTYMCKVCRREECDIPDHEHLYKLFDELEQLKHYVHALHQEENKSIHFEKTFKMVLPLGQPRTHASLVSTSFESMGKYATNGTKGHLGTRFTLRDLELDAYFYLKDYNTLYFRVDCPRSVQVTINVDGKSKACKSILLSRQRLQEKRDIAVTFTCAVQGPPVSPGIKSVEPRVLLVGKKDETTKVPCIITQPTEIPPLTLES